MVKVRVIRHSKNSRPVLVVVKLHPECPLHRRPIEEVYQFLLPLFQSISIKFRHCHQIKLKSNYLRARENISLLIGFLQYLQGNLVCDIFRVENDSSVINYCFGYIFKLVLGYASLFQCGGQSAQVFEPFA
jgi:hypothetical protein